MKIKRYKGVTINSFGIPVDITKKRRIKTDRVRNLYNISFESDFEKSSPKNLIVLYDIPHNMKKERDWFRRHLKKFNYIMIQKSVWVGPSPLPKEFLNYVKSIGILNNLKTLKLAKPYSENTTSLN